MQGRNQLAWQWWIFSSPIPDRLGNFWDGAAWGTRMLLAFIHLLFGTSALIRRNAPLLFPSFGAFDDVVPFWVWGVACLTSMLLLVFIRSSRPAGILPCMFSMVVFYLIGAAYRVGGGLLPGTLVYTGLGVASALLLIRSVWAYAIQVRWFRENVLKGSYGRRPD